MAGRSTAQASARPVAVVTGASVGVGRAATLISSIGASSGDRTSQVAAHFDR